MHDDAHHDSRMPFLINLNGRDTISQAAPFSCAGLVGEQQLGPPPAPDKPPSLPLASEPQPAAQTTVQRKRKQAAADTTEADVAGLHGSEGAAAAASETPVSVPVVAAPDRRPIKRTRSSAAAGKVASDPDKAVDGEPPASAQQTSSADAPAAPAEGPAAAAKEAEPEPETPAAEPAAAQQEPEPERDPKHHREESQGVDPAAAVGPATRRSTRGRPSPAPMPLSAAEQRRASSRNASRNSSPAPPPAVEQGKPPTSSMRKARSPKGERLQPRFMNVGPVLAQPLLILPFGCALSLLLPAQKIVQACTF